MGYTKITIDNEVLINLQDTTAEEEDVRAGKQFYTKAGELVEGTYTVPAEAIVITPSATEKITKIPSEGEYYNKVEVKPVQTTTLEINLSDYLEKESDTNTTYNSANVPYSQVTINHADKEEKQVVPSLSEQTVTPSNGKILKKVTVKAIPESYLQNIQLEAPIFDKILEAEEEYYGIKQVTISGYSTKFIEVDNELGEGI